MKSLFKHALLCSSLLLTLNACSNEKVKEIIREVPATADSNGNKGQLVVNINDQMSATELANAGEQLMMPQSLHLAYKVLGLSLEKDAQNQKAKFYYTFLERFMKFEGILNRLQPYVDKYGDREKFAKMIADIPNHSVRDFLLTPKEGAAPLKTADDIQKLLIEYRKAAENFRAYVMANQDSKMDLYLNPYLFTEMAQQKLQDSCEVSGTENEYKVVCDIKNMYTVKVNMADMMALKQLAAGEIAYLSLYTSYSVGSIESLLDENKTNKMTSQQIMEELEATKDFGLLLKDQGLSSLRKLGSDFNVGLKWAMKHKNSLCRIDPYGRPTARRGFLVGDICANTDEPAQRSLQIFDAVLAGTIKQSFTLQDGSTVDTRVNYMSLVDKPTNDVRQLAPASWSADGSKGTSFRDKSLNGVFPNLDADLIFEIKN